MFRRLVLTLCCLLLLQLLLLIRLHVFVAASVCFPLFVFTFAFSGILNARHYYRGIKAHGLMAESMWILYWEEFQKWSVYEDYAWRIDNLNTVLRNYALNSVLKV